MSNTIHGLEATERRKAEIREILTSQMNLEDKVGLLELFVRVGMSQQQAEDTSQNVESMKVLLGVK